MTKPRRRRASEWAVLVQQWARSGQSAEKFAAAHGVRVGTLKWWRTQLKRGSRGRTASQPSSGPRLVPVRVGSDGEGVADRRSPELAWELVAPTGHVLRVYEGSAAAVLRDALGVVARGRRHGR
jgi:transposase-like protein